MRKLSELGISPTPWKCVTYRSHAYGSLGEVKTADGIKMAVDLKARDAIMFAAAPKLYDELWKQCFGEIGTVNCRNCKGAELGNCHNCKLRGARAALAEAAGESEVKK